MINAIIQSLARKHLGDTDISHALLPIDVRLMAAA